MSYFVYDPRFRALGLGGRLDRIDVQALPANLQSVAEGNLDVVLSANLLSLDSGNGNPITRNILTQALPPRVQIVGNAAYVSLADGGMSTFVGDRAGGGSSKPAQKNTFVGASAGEATLGAIECVFIGAGAGKESEVTTNVIAIGSDAFATTGSINFSTDTVFIGKSAGRIPPFATNRLVVIGAHALSNAGSATAGTDAVLVGANVCAETRLNMANVVVIGSSAMEEASDLLLDSVVIGSRAARIKTHTTESTVIIGAFAMEHSIGNVGQSVIIGSRAGYSSGNVFSSTAIGHETLARVTVDGSTVVGSRVMGDIQIAISNTSIIGEQLTVSPLVQFAGYQTSFPNGIAGGIDMGMASSRHPFTATFSSPIESVYMSIFGIPETAALGHLVFEDITHDPPTMFLNTSHQDIRSSEGIVIVHRNGYFYGFIEGIPVDESSRTTFDTGIHHPADPSAWTDGALPFASMEIDSDNKTQNMTYTLTGDSTTIDFTFNTGTLVGNFDIPPETLSFSIVPSPEVWRKLRSRTVYAAAISYPWFSSLDPAPSWSTYVANTGGYVSIISGINASNIHIDNVEYIADEQGSLEYPQAVTDSVLIGCNTTFPSPYKPDGADPSYVTGNLEGVLYISLGEYMVCKADRFAFDIFSPSVYIKQTLNIGLGYSMNYDFEKRTLTHYVESAHVFEVNNKEKFRMTSNGIYVFDSNIAVPDPTFNPDSANFFVSMPFESDVNAAGFGIREGASESWLGITATRSSTSNPLRAEYTYRMQNRFRTRFNFLSSHTNGAYIDYRLDEIGIGVGTKQVTGVLADMGREIMTLTRSGNAGVSNTSPAHMLSVNGTGWFNGTVFAPIIQTDKSVMNIGLDSFDKGAATSARWYKVATMVDVSSGGAQLRIHGILGSWTNPVGIDVFINVRGGFSHTVTTTVGTPVPDSASDIAVKFFTLSIGDVTEPTYFVYLKINSRYSVSNLTLQKTGNVTLHPWDINVYTGFEPIFQNIITTILGAGTQAATFTSTGVTIPNPGTLSFGSSVRQMLNLWGTTYGLGVQSSALYLRSGGNQIYFYGGGVHSDTNGAAGTGGTQWGSVSSAGFSGGGGGLTNLNPNNFAVGSLSTNVTVPWARLTDVPSYQATIIGAASTVTSADLTGSRALVSTSTGKIGVSAVTSAELGYLDGVTSSIKTQLDGKQATIIGAASTVTSADLTDSRALVSTSTGKIGVSAVTSTELGYLDGVTSSIKTQLDGKASSSHNHDSQYINMVADPGDGGVGTGGGWASAGSNRASFLRGRNSGSPTGIAGIMLSHNDNHNWMKYVSSGGSYLWRYRSSVPTSFTDIGTTRMSLTSSGTLAVNGVDVASDRRIKEDIHDADTQRCFDIVKSLPLRRYKMASSYTQGMENVDRHRLGFIADEVEKVFAKAVAEREWAGYPDLKMVNFDQLDKCVWGALQETIKRAEAAEGRLAKTEADMARVLDRLAELEHRFMATQSG